ncbi:MAG: CvpA family protein [Paraprevotella sp.]|nr:CvpA family protein [Paraprevotella sp.]
MNGLDVFILIVIALGLIKGCLCGFFRQVVSIVGFLVGLLVACLLCSALGDWLAPHIGSGESAGRVLAFILLWIGVPVALSLLAHVLTKAIESVKLGGLNRLGGAVLGGLKYMIFLSCVLNVGLHLHLISADTESSSHLYHPVRAVSARLFEMCKAEVVHTVKQAVSADEEKGLTSDP